MWKCNRRKKTKWTASGKWIAASAFLCLARVCSAAVTISIPSYLQGDFIAGTTQQWVGEVKPGLFSGDYKITITAKKAVAPSGPVPCTIDQNLQVLIDTVTAVSKGNYVYCYSAGEEDERVRNLSTLDGYGVTCGTNTICSGKFKAAHDDIFIQNLEAPPHP